MARIFYAHFFKIFNEDLTTRGPLGPSYEGMVRSLVEMGNDVLYYVTSDFASTPWGSDVKTDPQYDIEKMKDTIRKFKPDLVIAMNNCIFEHILEVVDCPVLAYDADMPFYFNDKDRIRKNIDRYWFPCHNKFGLKFSKDYWKAKDDHFFLLPPATAMRPDDNMAISQNISFISSNFSVPYQIQQVIRSMPETHDELLNIFKQLKNDPYYTPDLDSVKSDSLRAVLRDGMDSFMLMAVFAGENRLKVLTLLTELGLGLYGTSSWNEIGTILPGIWMSYKKGNYYTLKHNQDIYNSSKIGININHPQNPTGYAFRVPDIMASSACLVSEPLEEIREYFGEHVEIPFFSTPAEAYDICKKLLNDEPMRRDIVERSQQAINQAHRYSHRIRTLGEIFNLDVTSNAGRGTFIRMFPEEYLLVAEHVYNGPLVVMPNTQAGCGDQSEQMPVSVQESAPQPLNALVRRSFIGRFSEAIISASMFMGVSNRFYTKAKEIINMCLAKNRSNDHTG